MCISVIVYLFSFLNKTICLQTQIYKDKVHTYTFNTIHKIKFEDLISIHVQFGTITVQIFEFD
jgi:hypothetical protein